MSLHQDFAFVSDIIQTDLQGCYKLVLCIHTQFDFHYIRFKILDPTIVKYDENGSSINVGDVIKILYENEKQPILKTISKVDATKCKICRVYRTPPKRSTRKNICKCLYLPKDLQRMYVECLAQLIAIRIKMHKHSLRLCMVFVDTNRCYFATVLQNDHLFSYGEKYIPQNKYKICGWKLSENSEGLQIKLMSCDKEQLSQNKKRKSHSLT